MLQAEMAQRIIADWLGHLLFLQVLIIDELSAQSGVNGIGIRLLAVLLIVPVCRRAPTISNVTEIALKKAAGKEGQ